MRSACVARRLAAGALGLLLMGIGWAVPAGATSPTPAAMRQALDDDDAGAGRATMVAEGARLFQTELTPEQGLGPLFNARSCITCHSAPSSGGTGPDGLGVALRVGRLENGAFDPLIGRGGPIARAHAVSDLGDACAVRPGIPSGANLTSVRNAPALFGLGLVDAIPDAAILAGVTSTSDGVHGQPNLVLDPTGTERVGRFGWKADIATLHQFVGEAFRNELGMTNPAAPRDLSLPAVADETGCAGLGTVPEDDGTMVDAVTAYITDLQPVYGSQSGMQTEGERLFRSTGCAACHTPSLHADERAIPLYSDLLLHEMGPALDDGVVQGQARGNQWRTTPLWGLGVRSRFLHDGRARSVQEAILAHGGEADAAVRHYRGLRPDEQEALLRLLGSL
jgi:CxxC motif-containing protein (DUF1111 family)